MVRYEMKKVLSRTGNQIALVFLAIVLLVNCYLAVSRVSYVDENGETKNGMTAVGKLKEAKQEWKGSLTEEKLALVIAENNRINQTEEGLSNEMRKQQIAYSKKQGFDDIRDMLVRAYGPFRDYDYYRVDALQPEDAAYFYDNRIEQLRQWLGGEAKNWYSEDEKDFLLTQYETLETPIYYEASEGFSRARDLAPAIIMITVLALGYLVSGIFPRESQLEAESIFYSSYYGRNRAVHAKLKAGFLLTTVIYWVMVILFSIVVLGLIGVDGTSSAIQTNGVNWSSFYHMNVLQQYLLIISGGYVGTLFFTFLTMFVSAKTKSAVIAVITPFVLIFIPSILSGIGKPSVAKITGLLPDQMLQMQQVTGTFNLYHIGGKIVGALPILFTVYGLSVIVLYLLIYKVYRKAEIK